MDIEVVDGRGITEKGKEKATDGGIVVAGVDTRADDGAGSTAVSGDDDEVFGSSLLGPVHFWGDSPNTARLLAPSIELINFDAMVEDEDDYIILNDKKGKGRASSRKVCLLLIVLDQPHTYILFHRDLNTPISPPHLRSPCAPIPRVPPKYPLSPSSNPTSPTALRRLQDPHRMPLPLPHSLPLPLNNESSSLRRAHR
jgi:hypothetical protein